MKRSTIGVLALLVSAYFIAGTYAAPIAIGLNGFSGAETVVNFNSIPNEQLITTQYAAQGVTFSAALYGMTSPGDLALFPNNGGGVIASNWLYSRGANQGNSFTATFSSSKNRVGFYASTNPSDDVSVAVAINGNPQGALVFNTQSQSSFVGLQDPNGFNSVTLTIFGSDNHFFAINDFRFEAIPEPATIFLTMCGAIALLAQRQRAVRHA